MGGVKGARGVKGGIGSKEKKTIGQVRQVGQ